MHDIPGRYEVHARSYLPGPPQQPPSVEQVPVLGPSGCGQGVRLQLGVEGGEEVCHGDGVGGGGGGKVLEVGSQLAV